MASKVRVNYYVSHEHIKIDYKTLRTVNIVAILKQWCRPDFSLGGGVSSRQGGEAPKASERAGVRGGGVPFPAVRKRQTIFDSWNGAFWCTSQVFWRTYFKAVLCDVKQNICIWNEYKTKDKRRHLYQHYSTTSAISATERSWVVWLS